MEQDPFKEYLRFTEPDKAQKAFAWSTAIGLQAVDGLTTSQYLRDIALAHIEGKITMSEALRLIDRYYESQPTTDDTDRTEEADKVSGRISDILSEPGFSFTVNEYLSIHRQLFRGILSKAGKLRQYNITKKEWVLDGATVTYGSASELSATLDYEFAQEKKYNYTDLTIEEIIRHLARFVASLWQIHAFAEGNTRTTAVFFIKYLRRLGWEATNDIFAANAWYFRNALVRANYSNIRNGIQETTEYLELFLRNLLLQEKNELRNRNMHVSGYWKLTKPDIGADKPDIGWLNSYLREQSARTQANARKLYINVYGEIFGRTIVMNILGIKNSASSEFLHKLLKAGVIELVAGKGKGKYRFIKPAQ